MRSSMQLYAETPDLPRCNGELRGSRYTSLSLPSPREHAIPAKRYLYLL